MEEVKTKVCPKCGEEKPLTGEFWCKHHATKSGFHCYCKECKNKQFQEWKSNNRDVLKNAEKRWKKAHPDKVIASIEKWRVVQAGKLSNSYIKLILNAHNNTIERKDITPEMIELKRVQIQMFRKTKQFLKEEVA